MLDSGIYIGECVLFSSRYNGKAVTISMQGCNVSTTHIQLVLTPEEQKTLIEWFCNNKRELVEEEIYGGFQNQKDLWCGNCGFKESETCDDKTTWKRCRLMSSEPEGKNVEERLELARNSAVEKVLGELKADLKTRFVSQSNQWCKGRNSGLLECCNIIDERLRGSEK